MFFSYHAKGSLVQIMQSFDLTLGPELLALIIPVLILELILLGAGLWDWRKQPKTMPNRWVWFVVLFMNIVGPIVYFLVAPRESSDIDFDDMEEA